MHNRAPSYLNGARARFYNCRQLTREELADEREPEFTIVEDESLELNSQPNAFSTTGNTCVAAAREFKAIADQLISLLISKQCALIGCGFDSLTDD